MSLVGVSEELLLLEETGCCCPNAEMEAVTSRDADRHSERSAVCRENDLMGEDTIIRRSHGV
jgi:hypothetical protein